MVHTSRVRLVLVACCWVGCLHVARAVPPSEVESFLRAGLRDEELTSTRAFYFIGGRESTLDAVRERVRAALPGDAGLPVEAVRRREAGIEAEARRIWNSETMGRMFLHVVQRVGRSWRLDITEFYPGVEPSESSPAATTDVVIFNARGVPVDSRFISWGSKRVVIHDPRTTSSGLRWPDDVGPLPGEFRKVLRNGLTRALGREVAANEEPTPEMVAVLRASEVDEAVPSWNWVVRFETVGEGGRRVTFSRPNLVEPVIEAVFPDDQYRWASRVLLRNPMNARILSERLVSEVDEQGRPTLVEFRETQPSGDVRRTWVRVLSRSSEPLGNDPSVLMPALGPEFKDFNGRPVPPPVTPPSANPPAR